MTATTQRFAFTTLNQGDEFSSADYAFGRSNRLQLDLLLQQVIENHTHNGAPAPSMSATPPQVQMVPSGGILPANHIVFYRTALVDPRGQEYVASQVISVATPPSLIAPEPPALSQALGGALQAGDYMYLLSAYTVDTSYETTPSRATSSTLVDGNQWTITMPALPSGATGWNIYRKGPTDLEPIFLTSTVTNTVIDNGALKASPFRTPPSGNTTSSMNSVVIGLEGQELPAGCTLKIYRTLDQGDWSRSFVNRVSGLPYTDTGHATQTGAPLARSIALGGAPKIRFFENTTGSLPPSAFVTARLATFNLAGPVTTGLSPWQWICEYDDAALQSIRATLGRGSTPAAFPVKATVWLRREGETEWTPIVLSSGETQWWAEVGVGQTIGPPAFVSSNYANPPRLKLGDALRAVVLQSGGGATPTDSDLSLTVTMLVRNGSATTTHVWKDD
jgi:hypothetical protein